MYFFIDEIKKVIFCWSPKCGSNHIRKLFYFLTGQQIHVAKLLSAKFPQNSSEYTLIIVMRNPFERIVSGFRYLYKDDGYCVTSWQLNKNLTFRNFVDELVENGTNNIDKYHFDPQIQLSETCPQNIPFKINKDKLYDISNIDYDYIETLYDIKIPDNIREFKGKQVNSTKMTTKLDLGDYLELNNDKCKVYDLELKEYDSKNTELELPQRYNSVIVNKDADTKNFKLELSQFYNQDIVDKVAKFYKADLEFINKYSVN